MDRKIKSSSTPDMGDYLKVFACAAVMLQIILGQALQTHPTVNIQIGIGICYNLIKFTAPAFITGILYTTMRVTHDTNLSYRAISSKCGTRHSSPRLPGPWSTY